ncbi:Purple acid phosphatase [Aphelenchoides bicaudatus]|nr:Purple acid phosphatase [Aphelenchoides bicaudatus]
MYIGAHVHIYERDWPTYRKRPYKGRFSPYTDPEAVTYVTIGNGKSGCLEKPPAISRKKSFFIANYSNNYGYGQVQACNQTHLQFKYFSSTGTVQDSFWLIRNTHGNYPPRV